MCCTSTGSFQLHHKSTFSTTKKNAFSFFYQHCCDKHIERSYLLEASLSFKCAMAPLKRTTFLWAWLFSFFFFLATVTRVLFRNERGLTVTCCQVIQLCRQTDVHRGAVERQLLCWHSSSYSADCGAWEFVQVVTVEQLIPSVWHAVGRFVWAVALGGGRRPWQIDSSCSKN